MNAISKAAARRWPVGRTWARRCLVLTGIWWCLWAHADNAPSVPPYLGERLVYRVSYQGALSGQSAVAIADAVLETTTAVQSLHGTPAYLSTLRVSTADYPAMEGFYPFRYRFRSYYSTDLSRAHYLDIRKVTRKDHRELVQFDWGGGKVVRYKKRGNMAQEPADEAAEILDGSGARAQGYRHDAKDDLPLDGALLDRLSLLQAVRTRDLFPGQAMEFSVSDGKAIYRYQIRVMAREPLQREGQTWDTYKLSFEGFERGSASPQAEHAPVFIWLTADSRRVPLRFASEALLGTFTIDLHAIDGQPVLSALAAGERVVGTPPP